MGANPHANGGLLLLRPAACRISATTRSRSTQPGAVEAEDTRVLGGFLRDVITLNEEPRNFRIFGPDETVSNRLDAVFEATAAQWVAETLEPDDHGWRRTGRVLEVLSEHQCQGWLEGYLLTGRHGLFNTYEAFAHIVDSMFNQHAKWLKVTRGAAVAPADRLAQLPARQPRLAAGSQRLHASGSGFHRSRRQQEGGGRPRVSAARRQLPAERDGPLPAQPPLRQHRRGRQASGAAVADMDAAVRHCTAGIGIWEWASNDEGAEPDLVMAAAGDVPTLETLAAVAILRQHLPDAQDPRRQRRRSDEAAAASEHPHGLSDADFDMLFTTDKPIIFAYHGYPWLIHRLTYRRTNHRNLHVRGYKEEGTITTPFDMAVLNDLDRFHLAGDAIDRLPQLGASAAHLRQQLAEQLTEHRLYIRRHGEDMPAIRDWRWRRSPAIRAQATEFGAEAWSLSAGKAGNSPQAAEDKSSRCVRVEVLRRRHHRPAPSPWSAGRAPMRPCRTS